MVVVVLRADVIHLVNAATLGATLNRALAAHLCLPLSASWTSIRPRRAADQMSDQEGAAGGRLGGQATYTKPDNVVGVGRVAGATSVLFVTGGADLDRILDGPCGQD